MKHLLFAVVASIFMLGCRKDYNCVCRYEVLGTDQVDIHEIDNVKRETARDKCEEFEDEAQLVFSDAVCEIE